MKRFLCLVIALFICIGATGCVGSEIISFSLDDIPEFGEEPYVVINENQPNFSENDLKNTSFEKYAPLDALGRCGVAYACIGRDLMPTEKRKSIGQIKPTGWQTVKYDFVDGKYLYNRCHLIGFQLTGENANERNLITGTRYMNVDGVLPFENMIADYIKETDNHVLYRVTPIFKGANLVASGVQLEALSIEDNGAGICFNVYAYNNQPGVVIDYATGISSLAEEEKRNEFENEGSDYVLNINSKKIHLSSCAAVEHIKDENKSATFKSLDELLDDGYERCGQCLKK